MQKVLTVFFLFILCSCSLWALDMRLPIEGPDKGQWFVNARQVLAKAFFAGFGGVKFYNL